MEYFICTQCESFSGMAQVHELVRLGWVWMKIHLMWFMVRVKICIFFQKKNNFLLHRFISVKVFPTVIQKFISYEQQKSIVENFHVVMLLLFYFNVCHITYVGHSGYPLDSRNVKWFHCGRI